MTARDRHEPHRTATPLELLFDLVFVVAVAQAGAQLVHAVAEGHAGEGFMGYAMVFFAIWWAWMNFSWFASAYDTDDVPYRVLTLLQMTGVLVLAAGVPRAFDDQDWLMVIIGYLVMRVALTVQWLRAASSQRTPARTTAHRYAAGLVLCQLGWLALLVLPHGLRGWWFALMVAAELALPVVAEHRHPTTWHPHHIAERYGLFTIIVLGEAIAAATVAVQSGLNRAAEWGDLLLVAAGGLLIVFAAWWIYFAVPAHEHLTTTNRRAFIWGYGHYLILSAIAAIGAGLEIGVEHAIHATHISTTAAAAAVTLPVALYLITVWLLHSRYHKRTPAQQLVLPLAAAAVLLCTFAAHIAVLATGVVLTSAVAVSVALAARQAAPSA